MRFVYVLITYLLAPVFCAAMLWRGLRDRAYWQGLGQRFGFGDRVPAASLWVHAVSAGEVQAAAPLVHALRQRYPSMPLVVTTGTPTGAARARSLFARGVDVRYLPFDLPGAVRRFFDRVRPRLAVVFETELWPNLYHECGRRGVPLVLASARVSPRSVGRYRWLVSLFRETLSHGIVIAAQSEGDAERFRSIGANPKRTHVTGNIKFDFDVPPETLAHGRALRTRHGAQRPVWVAGSTHAHEEDIVLEAHWLLRRTQQDALLLLVPRHPSRFADVAGWLARNGVWFTRRSHGTACTPDTEVLLVDTLGELLDFYAACDVAFVGGSLVPIGGHNLLEPAALGRPILTGPNNFNGEDIARLLIERGAARIVPDAAALAGALGALLSDEAERARIGAVGRAAVEENRGAVARLLGLIDPLLATAAEGSSTAAAVRSRAAQSP
ncbi:MAG TPA: lipid IV(A) 3-deoxy-D-manno-octulosonic acid transferase [Steroidobacteraceae bacterium]|nr:lipid IV(A) 3-deoxy-D-manno-octulosonic acid transferase [Steroidobacteraceae bacterium]